MQEGRPPSLLGSELDDRYRILSPLGEGGMGAVYLGEHIRIGRQVAIKVLNPELAKSEDFLGRFEREAIAAGRLDHPNCVPVTDSGHLDDGTAYLVMELVSGRSLGSVMASDGPGLEPIRALRIIRHVLRGLGHAHDMGIVHRDIKPDNIMLCERENDQDFARVLDFGIAKLRDEDNKDKAALTQDGMAVGTPAYLSPEQAFGDRIDLRSDLYSCSVVLFDMLCGRPPFIADNPIGVLTKHAATEPPHLWDIAPHLEDVPALDELVQRGLSKDREHRYQSAAEFVGAIDQTLIMLGSQLTPLPAANLLAASLQTGETPVYATGQTPGLGTAVTGQTPGLGTAVTGQTPGLGTAVTGLAPRAQTHPASMPVPTPAAILGTAATGLSPRAQTDPTMVGPQLARRQAQIKRGLLVGAVLLAMALVIALASRRGDVSARTAIPGGETNILLKTYQDQLENGKTCSTRLEAVEKLRALGDKRAIPSLKNARRRMRGGVLGIGKKNANRCLNKAAGRAIEELEKN